MIQEVKNSEVSNRLLKKYLKKKSYCSGRNNFLWNKGQGGPYPWSKSTWGKSK
jgi:hypothetical protein